MNSDDPGRIMLLMYVKTFIIAHLLAFSLSDSPDVRAFFEVCCVDAFPRTTLYPQMIKHFVAELYKATVSKFSFSIRNAIAGAGRAVLHANFDLWTSKLSNEKYIGASTRIHRRRVVDDVVVLAFGSAFFTTTPRSLYALLCYGKPQALVCCLHVCCV